MRSDLKGSKTAITLHEADKRAMKKVIAMLRFIELNSTDGPLATSADTGAKSIGEVMNRLCAETPEVDTPTDKPKVKVPA